MLEPMSSTPRRMPRGYRRPPLGLGWAGARGRPGVPPCLDRVRGPRRRRPGVPLRPHLAHVELDLHLRRGLPGHLRHRARGRLLHARRALLRRGRRGPGQGVGRPARRHRLAPPRPGAGQARPGPSQGLGRDRRRGRAQDPRRRRRLHLPQPARLGCRLRLRPARPRAGRATCTSSRPSPTSAGSCRSGAPTATSSGPTAPPTSRSASRSTTAAAGAPAAHDLDWYCSGNTEAHVGAEPVYLSNAVELVTLMGQPAYDVLAAACERHLRSRSALALHPADPRH